MRSFTRISLVVAILAILLAPSSQIQAQAACGVCIPKDTTASALAALKARVDSANKLQDVRIASLQASRAKMQKDINVLSGKILDLQTRSEVDTVTTNKLANMNIELARLDSAIAEQMDFRTRQLAWNEDTESHINALDRVNKDTKEKTSGLSTGTKWGIAGGVTAVVATILVGNHNHWWGGSTTTVNSSSYSSSCSNCRR